jgi:hypothetical protein
LYSGVRDGLRTAVLAFEPRKSDLPLQVAFPILLANLTGELLGGSTAPTEAVEPGSPVELVIPPGAVGLTVTTPDGAVVDLVRGTTQGEGATVTFAGTGTPGIYTVTPVPDPDASPAPSGAAGGAASARPTPASSARPSSSPASGAAGASPGASVPPDDPMASVRFAVDLFDVNESNTAPGSAAAIEGLGTTAAAASPGPGASAAPPAAATQRPTTRDELWVPIVLIVLLALCIEWALYHRDGLVRMRRSFLARLGRDPGTAG